MPSGGNLTPQYKWDEKLGRYRDARGRLVAAADVRRALDLVIVQANQNISGLTNQLVKGDLTLAEWQTAMAKQLKIYHTASAALANGGWGQMTKADWGRVGAQLREQYKFLRDFAKDIAAGRTPLDGRAIMRSQLYTEAMRGTYESERRHNYRKRANEERRVLGISDHCGDCIDAEARGWQPIGTLPRIGDSVCGGRCHCTFEYRRVEE